MPSKEEHYSRNRFQERYSYNNVQDAKKNGFTQLGISTGEDPEGLDACHENGIAIPNANGNNKYTKRDKYGGSYELIYDSNGNLVTDEVNKGTYNFVDPKGIKGKLGHAVKDVIPYIIYGNSENDPSTPSERLMGTINAPFGKYSMDVNLSKKEANTIRSQEQQRAKEAALARYNDHH